MDTTQRLSSKITTGVILILAGMLSACSTKATCDDAEAVEKMLDLAKSGVITDLTGQGARELSEKSPTVAARCPADGSEQTQCIDACRGWAETSVTAQAGVVETLFQDATVSTQRCRAEVRFDVAYDGGQVVASKITYLVKPDLGGVQVALSQ